jgi:hypothetical protein
MKVNLKEDGIRKALALIPANSQDPDLQQLRDTLERRLEDVQTSDQLTAVELEAVVDACKKFKAPYSQEFRRSTLSAAVTKLVSLTMKARAREAAGE